MCSKLKEVHPDKPCDIAYGVTLPKSYCPIGNWWKSCSIVWVYADEQAYGEELRYSIRSAHQNLEYNNVVVCGDHPDWYIGHSIKRKQERDKWTDSITKLKSIINDPKVTDTFLWMYDDTFIVQPTTIKEINNCKYGEDWDRNSHGAWYATAMRTLELLPPGKRRNYSTHYPVVFNKQKLQEVIDKYPLPYLIETLYLNLHGENPQPMMDNDFQFSRNCMEWRLNPEVPILNVKQFTPRVAATIKPMFTLPSPYELC